MCVCVPTCPWRPERAVDLQELEPLCRCWELNTGSMPEQFMLRPLSHLSFLYAIFCCHRHVITVYRWIDCFSGKIEIHSLLLVLNRKMNLTHM